MADNAYTLCPRPLAALSAIASEFQSGGSLGHYARVLCMDPPAMCEAALVARVSKVLMLVQGRLERAREAPERWLPFLASMAAALDDGRLQLLVSNRYDQAYVKYFTGYLAPLAHPLPPTRREPPLVFDALAGEVWIMTRDDLWGAHDRLSASITHMLQHDPHLTSLTVRRVSPSTLASEGGRVRAVVWLPWEADSKALWGVFGAGVPVLAPSLALLLQWEAALGILADRIHAPWPPRPEPLAAQGGWHPSDASPQALREWLGSMEWLHWPQDSVILFDHPRAIPAAIASLPLEAVGAAAVRFAQGVAAENERVWAAAMSWFVEDEDEKRAPGMAAHEQGEGHAMKDEDKGRRERGTGVGGGGGLVQLPAWYAEADAQGACQWSSRVEVKVHLSFDLLSWGVLKLSSLYPPRLSIDAFCRRNLQASPHFFAENCSAVRRDTLASLESWLRWQWPEVVDREHLFGLTRDLTDRLASFQVEGFAAITQHALVSQI